jgi:hypothetical protein
MEVDVDTSLVTDKIRLGKSKKNLPLNTGSQNFQNLVDTKLTSISQIQNDTKPNWVDDQFGWDPKNPRKPCMKEVVDALMTEAGHKDLTSFREREKFYHDASEFLYGVLGSKDDSRDWDKILSSENISNTARDETKKMYGPELDIITTKRRVTSAVLGKENSNSKQYAVIKDREGNILRTLDGSDKKIRKDLTLFGVEHDFKEKHLRNKIEEEKFDTRILQVLRNTSEEEFHEQSLTTADLLDFTVKNVKLSIDNYSARTHISHEEGML